MPLHACYDFCWPNDLSAVTAFRAENEKPTCIILDTLKGKGVSFMENSVDWHGKGPNDEGAKACIEAGFTSIMFDGSHYPIEENIAKTRELVELAHDKGLSIEAEVGSIGGVEDGVVGNGEIADPEECAKITALGVDFLAAGIGNIHGIYPANWKGLNFEALERIHQATNNIPLVLHGGTGIPDEMVQKAIRLGVSKINVNTDCQLVFAEATRKYIEAGKDQQGKGYDPRKLLKAVHWQKLMANSQP